VIIVLFSVYTLTRAVRRVLLAGGTGPLARQEFQLLPIRALRPCRWSGGAKERDAAEGNQGAIFMNPYQLINARNRTVRLPVAELTWPKLLAVTDVLPRAKNGWFRKFSASSRKPTRSFS
jgi:hypothetical protein